MRMNIFRRIIFGFAVIMVFVLFIGIYNVIVLENTVKQYSTFVGEAENEDLINNARIIQVDFKKQVQEWKNILLRGHNPADLKKYTAAFLSLYETTQRKAARLQRVNLSAESKATLEQFIDQHKRLQQKYLAGLEMIKAGAGDNDHKADTYMRGKDRLPTNLLDILVEQIVEESRQRNTIIYNQAKTAEKVSLMILAITVLLAIGISYWIAAAISKALKVSIFTITASSAQILAMVNEQEHIASQQSSAVNQTTTTMLELNSSAQQSSEQADATVKRSLEVMQLTEEGTCQVIQNQNAACNLKEKVDGIAEQILQLSQQTSQIQGITKLVTDLANQIHLLALNAAVEAARAGEQGKGFAVVAVEIRKLADASKKSAGKINILVDDIQRATNSTVMATKEGTRKVDEMTHICEQSVNVFNNISFSANSATESVQQIQANIQQQADAIEQVMAALSSLNSDAKQTAMEMTQTKVGVQKINEAAKELQAMV